MESLEDLEMEEGDSEEEDEGDTERILDPNVTPFRAAMNQISSSSSSSGSKDEGRGTKGYGLQAFEHSLDFLLTVCGFLFTLVLSMGGILIYL